MKTCRLCEEKLAPSEFYRCKTNLDGLMGVCKQCHNKRCKKWQKDNTEKSNEHTRRWYTKHGKAWSVKNREQINVKYRKWYANSDKKRVVEYGKKWRRKNKDRVNANQRKRYHTKLKHDIRYRLNNSMGMNVYHSLKSKKNGASWQKIVGYTVEHLMTHLVGQFVDGMSWENYGEWHIDHIIPKSRFEFNSYNDKSFKRCWSLDNLQPLWAFDNRSKNNIYIDPMVVIS